MIGPATPGATRGRVKTQSKRPSTTCISKLVDDVGLLPKGLAAAESWRQEFTALRRLRLERAAPLGSLPLVVLERGHDSNPLWHSQQVDLAGLSSAGRLVTVEGSGHMIHLYNPTVVVQAIRDVVRSVRASHRKPEPARADG